MVLAEWRRAVESLHAAELLAAEGFETDAVSRAYYAVLHAAKAALAAHDVSVESHGAVKRLFGLHLIQPGTIEREWAALLVESLDDRLTADYDVESSFSSDEAEGDCRRARSFLNRIRRYLRTQRLSADELGSVGRLATERGGKAGKA